MLSSTKRSVGSASSAAIEPRSPSLSALIRSTLEGCDTFRLILHHAKRKTARRGGPFAPFEGMRYATKSHPGENLAPGTWIRHQQQPE